MVRRKNLRKYDMMFQEEMESLNPFKSSMKFYEKKDILNFKRAYIKEEDN